MQDWQLSVHELHLLGRRMQKARKVKNMTQQEIAEALDCSIAHISALENGKTMMSARELVFFCRIYDCDLRYFFRDILAVDSGTIDKRQNIIQYLFSSCSDETLHSIASILAGFLRGIQEEIENRNGRKIT